MSAQHWAALTLALAACGIWQVSQWLQSGVDKLHGWLRRRQERER